MCRARLTPPLTPPFLCSVCGRSVIYASVRARPRRCLGVPSLVGPEVVCCGRRSARHAARAASSFAMMADCISNLASAREARSAASRAERWDSSSRACGSGGGGGGVWGVERGGGRERLAGCTRRGVG